MGDNSILSALYLNQKVIQKYDGFKTGEKNGQIDDGVEKQEVKRAYTAGELNDIVEEMGFTTDSQPVLNSLNDFTIGTRTVKNAASTDASATDKADVTDETDNDSQIAELKSQLGIQQGIYDNAKLDYDNNLALKTTEKGKLSTEEGKLQGEEGKLSTEEYTLSSLRSKYKSENQEYKDIQAAIDKAVKDAKLEKKEAEQEKESAMIKAIAEYDETKDGDYDSYISKAVSTIDFGDGNAALISALQDKGYETSATIKDIMSKISASEGKIADFNKNIKTYSNNIATFKDNIKTYSNNMTKAEGKMHNSKAEINLINGQITLKQKEKAAQ